MQRLLKLTGVTLVVLAASVTLYVTVTVPQRARQLTGAIPATTIYGAYHIHTARSDGAGTVEDVAAAAARAGLAFVILTDHGDGTRPPDPPTYRSGVLCIDAVELNTADGHVVALGLNGPSPYPLAGEGRDVVEDVHRLGGRAVVAHPDSPKPELQWRAWNTPYDGVEWLNVDSEWRDESATTLVGAGLRSLARAPETIASLFRRPARTLDRWDAAARRRPVFGVAAVDAHARMIGWEDGHTARARTLVGWPTYAALFRTVTQAVELDQPLTKDAPADAAQVVGALVAGRTYSIINAQAWPASLDFYGTDGRRVPMGGTLGPNATLSATVPQAPDARVVLLHNGRELRSGRGRVEYSGPMLPGAYRVEVSRDDAGVPWIVSSPIYGPPVEMNASDPPASRSRLVALPPTGEWVVEKDQTSAGTFASEGRAVRLDFRLGPGAPAGQYAAVAGTVAEESGIERVQFTIRSDRPMRLSVQLRLRHGRDGQRWRRSVYADATTRTVVVPLQEFEPVDVMTSQRPVVAPVQSVLFVVDTLNTPPGTTGSVWISDIGLAIGKLEKGS